LLISLKNQWIPKAVNRKKQEERIMKKKVLLIVQVIFLVLFTSVCLTPTFAATTSKGKSVTSSKKKTTSSKRKVARTRKDMILEIEMKALKEAIETRKDQESTNTFATKAAKEFETAKTSADGARTMLDEANSKLAAVIAAKEAALAAIEKARIAAEEARTLADQAKMEAKLAGVDASTYLELRKEAKNEVIRAEAREASAVEVYNEAKAKEQYYRNLISRRLKNAEDFYYIAEAAMKKGGNAQALEFAVKAKAEMEQAKIAENEAAIRAEATMASQKVVESRKESTEAARIKSLALAKLIKLSEEITTALAEAYDAAKLSAAAAQKVLAKTQDLATSKDEVLTFSNKKVESLADIKNAAERKEILASTAAEAARAVVIAKEKALAEAEGRARTALADARTMVIGTAAEPEIPAEGEQPVEEQPAQ
jgi:hypothetical protein